MVPQDNDNVGLAALKSRTGTERQGSVRKEMDMRLTVKCFCGAVVQTDDEDDLVAQVSAHALSVHDLELSRTDVLAMANVAEG